MKLTAAALLAFATTFLVVGNWPPASTYFLAGSVGIALLCLGLAHWAWPNQAASPPGKTSGAGGS